MPPRRCSPEQGGIHGHNGVGAFMKLNFLSKLGPGLITGAADDDPSGIATYSQVGAQFGYAIGWTMIFSYPLMAAIQEISGRIGRVTGRGIAANLRRHYPRPLLHAMVVLLLVANIINLGADLGAMGDSLDLVIGGVHRAYYVVALALLCAGLQIFSSYQRYVIILKWMTLVLLAYVATAFAVHIPWGTVARQTLLPSPIWNKDYLLAIVAILGTTISPYMFFWQSSEEAEEERIDPNQKPLKDGAPDAKAQIRRIEFDTYIGMFASNIVGLFIIVTTAATLHASGHTDIQTSSQAAEALRPLAGNFAFLLFALGIVGTGLLAVPVLAGSAAYAVGEALRWKVGLARRPHEAKAFYGLIAAATLIGIGFNLVKIDPIKALFWTAVINGIVAAPLMVVMMMMTANPKVMGQFTLPVTLRIVGWVATVAMTVTALALIASWFV
jgi:NRAMP (natural resistance-associated macrophage protein)-like metal ion transporter